MKAYKFNLNPEIKNISRVVGANSKNIALLESKTNTVIELQPEYLIVNTDSEEVAKKVYDIVKTLVNISNQDNSIQIRSWDVSFLLSGKQNNGDNLIKERQKDILDVYQKPITTNYEGRKIYPKTKGQAEYLQQLQTHELVFCIGPAGSGKTFVAMVYAIEMLKRNEIKKIILSRPAIEAGEALGFLPGGLKEKIDPYLIPLYDSLYFILGKEKTENLLKTDIIEIAPLAFMRGRTFENCFVILDEAQNSNQNQMKLFLTRLGFSSKMVITGDATQIDLHPKSSSGLLDAIKILSDVKPICFVKLTEGDIVRNPIVKDIVQAYDKAYDSKENYNK